MKLVRLQMQDLTRKKHDLIRKLDSISRDHAGWKEAKKELEEINSRINKEIKGATKMPEETIKEQESVNFEDLKDKVTVKLMEYEKMANRYFDIREKKKSGAELTAEEKEERKKIGAVLWSKKSALRLSDVRKDLRIIKKFLRSSDKSNESEIIGLGSKYE